MSEMAKKARADMRAKARRMTTADPHQKVDASDWTPPEALRAGRKVYDKSKERSATAKIYKHGGKVQGDRGPRRKDKAPRCDGGRMERASGGSCAPEAKAAVHKHEKHDHKGEALTKLKRGGEVRTGNKTGNYMGGTRPTGGRIARAHGGRTGKGKTNINIIIGREHQQQPPMTMVPPPQQITKPPMPAPPPGPPPGMGGPPGGPPGMPPGPPPGMMPPGGGMPRARGGRAGRDIEVPMHAGAGSGEGRLEKIKRHHEHHR